jgi:hypothetical protein
MLPRIACPCLALNLFILFRMTFPESRPPPHRYPILKSECWEVTHLSMLGFLLISPISNDSSACVKTARVFQRFATWTRRHFVGTLTNQAARGDDLLIAGTFARLYVLIYREYCETFSGTVTRAEMQNMVYFGYLKVQTEEFARFPMDSLLTSERVTSVTSDSSIKWY